MPAPADQDDRDASQLYYSYQIIKGGAGERVRWVGERAILVAVAQCLLLLIHHSYITHAVSWRGARGGGGGEEGCCGKDEVGG